MGQFFVELIPLQLKYAGWLDKSACAPRAYTIYYMQVSV